MMALTGEQPPPISREGVPSVQQAVITDLVVYSGGDLLAEDVAERERVGIQRYGTPLQPHNGRDMIRDAYDEALDLVIYLRGALLELEDLTGDREHGDSELVTLYDRAIYLALALRAML